MKRQSQSGQATMELMIGIIALVVIMVGIVTFGEGGYHWLSSVNEAANSAWVQSIAANSGSAAGTPEPFIKTWDNSFASSQFAQQTDAQGLGIGYMPDGSTSVLQYNFKDAQVLGTAAQFNTIAKQILDQSIAGNPYIAYLDSTETYLKSQPLFAQAVAQPTTTGWLIGQSSHVFKPGQIDRGYGTPVDFGTALQNFVYGAGSLNLQSQVFLPPISGLQ
jgi:hypothetical protein